MVNSLDELIAILPEGEGVPVSPKKFITLYRSIPEPLKRAILDPAILADHSISGKWQRTSVWRKENEAIAYLIDKKNRVIQSLRFSRELLDAIPLYGKVTEADLEDYKDFAGNVFDADSFFVDLNSRPPEFRQELFPDPDFLLELPQSIRRIGIAPPLESREFGLLGFESQEFGKVTVTMYPVSSEALMRLFIDLKHQSLDSLAVPDSLAVKSDSKNPKQKQGRRR